MASIPTKCADLSRSAGLACLGCRSTLDYLLDLTQGDPHLGGPADLVGVLEIIYKDQLVYRINMCGETHRPTFGGTIAVLFPCDNTLSSERSLSSSPDSITSQSTSSSTSSLSSYSLFFRDTSDQKTKAIFQIDDPETYQALENIRNVDLRIEKYGDLSTATPSTAPLHQFRLDLSQKKSLKPGFHQTGMEFELPERLDLGVSDKGVVGRQVTLREAEGAVLGIGIVGYN